MGIKYLGMHEVSPWDGSHRIILVESEQKLNSRTSPWYPASKQAILETRDGEMFMAWTENNCPRGLVPDVVYQISQVTSCDEDMSCLEGRSLYRQNQ